MINYYIKFITCEESFQLKSSDFKSYKYETKKKVEESVYDVGKRNFCERRGGLWRAHRPRQIRQLESKLRDKTVIACEWTNDSLVTIVFSSGAIAYLTIKPDSLDVTQILFDRYFVGKLSGQTVTSVVLCKSHILFTHIDRVATFVNFGKSNISSQPCRITDRDPHLHCIELGGGARRTERHVSWCENSSGVRVLVWSVTTAEPAPWSPVLEDHANLHLYQLEGQNMTLMAYHQLENETLSVELSHKCDNVVHIVEQVSSQKNVVSLDWIRYDVANAEERAAKLSSSRESATSVSLAAPARVVRRSPCDARLLAACIDGSLHVIHHIGGLTHSTKAGFIATEVRWADELIIAAEEGGRLQCFDRALSLLNHHTKFLDLTAYLRDTRRLKLLASRNTKCGPLVLASFIGGPLTLLHITHPRLLTAWIRARRTSSAVALLRAMDWDREGTECLWAVNKLVCAALRSGAEAVAEEGCAQAALGCFLAPGAPHSPHAMRFAPPVHDLARKFFHHLLRRGRIEKALSLGVDLAAWDLFCDARWAAQRRALARLAHEAAALAHHCVQQDAHDSECSESCSECSSHSYTESEEETNASSEAPRSKAPPLPRVSLSNHPTLLTVPVSQQEPVSTTSIRPNLHQYLERDTSIWNRNVKEDAYLKTSEYGDRLKPILSHNTKWHSVDGLSNYKTLPKHGLSSINEGCIMPSRSVIDIIPRPHDERVTAAHFKHLFQTELREEAPNTLYRYQNNNNYHPSTSLKDRYRNEGDATERHGNRAEKNKVKFSDTVTVAVVSEGGGCPDSARELADSLPLSPPHRYLAAFAPHPHTSAAPPAPPIAHRPPPGTTLDYVEV